MDFWRCSKLLLNKNYFDLIDYFSKSGTDWTKSSLRISYLDFNLEFDFKEIKNDTFKNMDCLEKIEITSVKLDAIEPLVFKNLKNLKILQIYIS